MDFNNGLYVFNGVPGFDSSKGERIVKSLQKLQSKIKHLEQKKESEKEFSSKEVQTNNNTDLTLTDVKFKLLVIQLQYLRSIFRKMRPNLYATPLLHDIENQNKETQTGLSLLHEPETPYNDVENISKSVNHDRNAAKDNKSPNMNFPSSSVLKESQQHYHLKFDDVPFILGASSSASHNVVANVQNIIAMMKTHNKVLCGPRFHSRNTPTASTSTKSCSQDANKMLQKLSEELSELQVKQERLKERFDTAQSGSHFANSKKETVTAATNSDVIKKDAKKHEIGNHSPNAPSSVNSRTSKCLKFKNREVTKREKHAVPSNRMQENLSQMSRQRLLRSLQDFKTHLTEEDISWD